MACAATVKLPSDSDALISRRVIRKCQIGGERHVVVEERWAASNPLCPFARIRPWGAPLAPLDKIDRTVLVMRRTIPARHLETFNV